MIEETSVPGDRSLDLQGMARFPVIVLEPCDKSAELSLGKGVYMPSLEDARFISPSADLTREEPEP